MSGRPGGLGDDIDDAAQGVAPRSGGCTLDDLDPLDHLHGNGADVGEVVGQVVDGDVVDEDQDVVDVGALEFEA